MSALLLSCSGSIKTFSHRDKKIDLKQYKSYAWIAPGDSVFNAKRKDKIFGGLIVHSSDEELKKKGMVIDVTTPDALFMFETQLEDKVQYSQGPTVSMGFGVGGPGYYVAGSAPIAGGGITASRYTEGMLVVSMFDTKTGKEIWSGGAENAITPSTDVEKLIETAVKYIFMRLPLKHKKQ